MESKLDALKSMVADMFKEATDKTSIENMAKLNNSIEEVEKEQNDLVKKNAELVSSYKELVKHTSFNDDHKPQDVVSGNEMPSFEDALNAYMAK